MFLRIAASGIGSITIVGTGLGIYLANKSKNDTNNPQLSENSPEKVDQKQNITTNKWAKITDSEEYKAAKESGKLLDVISYKDGEVAEGDFVYCLIQIDWKDWNKTKKINKVSMWMDKEELFSATLDDGNYDGDDYDKNFPLICFENESDDTKELDFNKSKTCLIEEKNGNKSMFSHKYALAIANFQDKSDKLQQLHTEKPTLKIELSYENSNEKTSHDAQVLNVLNEGYNHALDEKN